MYFTTQTMASFSNVQVLNIIPDPGALNSCMHIFPEKTYGLPWIYYVCNYLDAGFETLNLKLRELKLRELTVLVTEHKQHKHSEICLNQW